MKKGVFLPGPLEPAMKVHTRWALDILGLAGLYKVVN